MNDIIETWKSWKAKKNVFVFSKSEVRDAVKELEKIIPKSEIAIISIEGTPECIKYWIEPELGDYDNEHPYKESSQVLNLDFDDLISDRVWKGHLFRTITEEQAKKTVEFIERNLGKYFVIHCKAGRSRSQGIAKFILNNYPDYYVECPINHWDNPNTRVIRELEKV